jgi:hypothetical protein
VSTQHYRILTTLLDPTTATAHQIAQAYTARWQAETAYRMLKIELRGSGRRLRSTSPDQARQEIWGLLTVHNALVDQAVTAATDLDTPVTTISYTAVLTAVRNHLVACCPRCGYHPDTTDLTTTVTATAPNRRRTRLGPRTARQRSTSKTRDVTHTITITDPTANLDKLSRSHSPALNPPPPRNREATGTNGHQRHEQAPATNGHRQHRAAKEHPRCQQSRWTTSSPSPVFPCPTR